MHNFIYLCTNFELLIINIQLLFTMKKNLFGAAIVSAMLSLASCGGLGTTSTTTTGTDTGDLIGSVLGTALGTGTTGTGMDAGSLIGGVIGQLLGGTTSASSIVGTWVYTEPSVQFESENLLAKAGGAVASNTVVNKINPYYQAIGITPGAFAITFNSDNTCSYTMRGQTYNGTYQFDPSTHQITIQGQILTFPKAYVTVSANQMAMTFDASKLLTLAQGLASASQNSTLSTISSLSKSFSGMKTGFMFQRR